MLINGSYGSVMQNLVLLSDKYRVFLPRYLTTLNAIVLILCTEINNSHQMSQNPGYLKLVDYELGNPIYRLH